MIKSELDTVWIASDRKKFVNEDEALRHEETIGRETRQIKHRLRHDNTRRP